MLPSTTHSWQTSLQKGCRCQECWQTLINHDLRVAKKHRSAKVRVCTFAWRASTGTQSRQCGHGEQGSCLPNPRAKAVQMKRQLLSLAPLPLFCDALQEARGDHPRRHAGGMRVPPHGVGVQAQRPPCPPLLRNPPQRSPWNVSAGVSVQSRPGSPGSHVLVSSNQVLLRTVTTVHAPAPSQAAPDPAPGYPSRCGRWKT